MPCFNARLIRRRSSIALWIPDLDGPVRLVLDVALADFLAKADQILCPKSFIHHEEDIDLIERIDCLHGDVVGIAGTDADDKNFSHLQSPPPSASGLDDMSSKHILVVAKNQIRA